MILDADDANRGINEVASHIDFPKVRQGLDEPDRAVPAHIENVDVVEENHPRHAVGLVRFDQNPADQNVRASRLENDSGPEIIELLPQQPSASRDWTKPKIGATGNHDPGRLATRMGIHNLHRMRPSC